MCDSCGRFQESLHYSSPAHGGWGVVRTAMLVPDSYQLFVCPFACGRHGAIGACCQGLKHRLSYLYLSEEDIVSGSYEEQLLEATGKLFSILEKKPKVLMIFVSCLDDLLGTDHEPIVETLSQLYPEVKFTFCHMNPLSLDSKLPPAINVQKKMYGLLDPVDEKEPAVNLIGNLVDIHPDSDLFTVLREMGWKKVNHISHFEQYDEYQQMAKGSYNLALTPVGKVPCQEMERDLGIPYMMNLVRSEERRVGKEC